MKSFHNLMAQLLKAKGFTLQKISRSTYPQDVVSTHIRTEKRGGSGYTAEELQAIMELLEGGDTFRCRIGQDRFHYGRTPSEAIEEALKGASARKR